MESNSTKQTLCKFLIGLFAIVILVCGVIYADTKDDYISARADVAKQKIDSLQSNMLCMTHLYSMSRFNQTIYKQIEKATLLKYQQLITFLDEIRKKNDYRFSDDEWSVGAKDAWKRAVAVINNQVGIHN